MSKERRRGRQQEVFIPRKGAPMTSLLEAIAQAASEVQSGKRIVLGDRRHGFTRPESGEPVDAPESEKPSGDQA